MSPRDVKIPISMPTLFERDISIESIKLLKYELCVQFLSYHLTAAFSSNPLKRTETD